MLARLARFDVDAYLIEAAGKPVGYLQAWFDDEAANCGIDMFLIPSARGRGLGPDSARALARFLLHEAGRMRVTVDPYVWNERAIRAWKKAGFVRSRSAGADDEHSAAWLLMTLEPDWPGPRSAGLLTPQPGAF